VRGFVYELAAEQWGVGTSRGEFDLRRRLLDPFAIEVARVEAGPGRADAIGGVYRRS
jgi:hypothetical protein